MVTQLQPDVRAYLHGGEVIKRYIRVEEVAHEYGFSVEETEYIAKAASSLYKLTRIHLVIIRCLTRQQMARESLIFIR